MRQVFFLQLSCLEKPVPGFFQIGVTKSDSLGILERYHSSHCYDEMLNKSTLRTVFILAHSLMVPSILMDKLWQQELDIDDHIESSQEVELDECLVSACFLLFIQSKTQA